LKTIVQDSTRSYPNPIIKYSDSTIYYSRLNEAERGAAQNISNMIASYVSMLLEHVVIISNKGRLFYQLLTEEERYELEYMGSLEEPVFKLCDIVYIDKSINGCWCIALTEDGRLVKVLINQKRKRYDFRVMLQDASEYSLQQYGGMHSSESSFYSVNEDGLIRYVKYNDFVKFWPDAKFANDIRHSTIDKYVGKDFITDGN